MNNDIILQDKENKDFPAFYTYPDNPSKSGGIILIHEIWGLNPHIKDVAKRLKDQGYAVIAPDLFSDISFEQTLDQSLFIEMMNPKTRDEAQKKMRTLFAPINSPDYAKKAVSKLQGCFDFLKKDNHSNGNIAVMGFCFGGTYSFALAAAQPGLKAALPFYGHPPEPLDRIKTISCPIFAFYGEKDPALINQLPELEQTMKKYHKQFEYKVYTGSMHAFFNDTNPITYNKEAALDAWTKVLSFLKDNL